MSATAAALRSGFHRVTTMMSPGHRGDMSMMPPPPSHFPGGLQGGPQHGQLVGQLDPGQDVEDVRESVAFNMELSFALEPPVQDQIIWESPGANAWYLPPDPNLRRDIFENKDLISDPSTISCLAQQRLVIQVATWLDHLEKEFNGACASYYTVSRPRQTGVMATEKQKIPSLAVSFTGPRHMVRSFRMLIINQFPIMTLGTVSAKLENVMHQVDGEWKIRQDVLRQVEEIALMSKSDIFLGITKKNEQGRLVSSVEKPEEGEATFFIIGDRLVEEAARIRLLILIDKIMGMFVDTMRLDLPAQPLLCGRQRKFISDLQASTGTTIYLPPRFPGMTEYTPAGSQRRHPDELIISGQNKPSIALAKQRIAEQASKLIPYFKEIQIEPEKVDEIMLQRSDKLAKMSDDHAAFILVNPIGRQSGHIRISAANVLNIERAARELMAVAAQFYSAEWTLESLLEGNMWPQDIDLMRLLCDICIASRAEVIFSDRTFKIFGSDTQVRSALTTMSNVRFIQKTVHHIKVKVELANEHKEFVSGKKNGKINKIMHHANVQILFDGFNEYDFHIVIRGPSFDTIQHGLELVEAEMPSSISFHVPDKYHKRIIGIGGTHIQSIMKKHSVFVKFSNAMDRGVNSYTGGGHEEDIKVENVVCRTPTRNASSLDLVKNEIMDMVDSELKEVVDEQVPMERWIHRDLLTRHREQIEHIEKEHNCSVTFPSAEEAKDYITITGPELQVHRVIDAILALVPESHEMHFTASPELKQFLISDEFTKTVLNALKTQFPVIAQLVVGGKIFEGPPTQLPDEVYIRFSYTRNNQGSVKDAIEFLVTRLGRQGLDASTVKGMIPRPKSDSFEDSLPFFESKVLHRADPTGSGSTDSPTRSIFGDAESASITAGTTPQPGFFAKIRKGPSMSSFSSFIEGRKNRNTSPGSLFRHASSNASKASLISIESQNSGYRNPWNDSGINLPEDDQVHFHNHLHQNVFPGNGLMGPPTHSSAHGVHTPTHLNGNHGPTSNFSSSAHHGATSHHNVSNNHKNDHRFPHYNHIPNTGETTPTSARYDPRASFDSGRPSTSHSFQGYPGAIGPPR